MTADPRQVIVPEMPPLFANFRHVQTRAQRRMRWRSRIRWMLLPLLPIYRKLRRRATR